MALHFADIWEAIADRIPDEPAVIQGARTVSWKTYEQQAARLASRFETAGLGPGKHVGMFLYNSPEYLITQFATFKHGTVGVNVNYRYLDDELLYLLDNADIACLVYNTSLGDRVARIKDRLPNLRLLIEVDDSSVVGAENCTHVDGAITWDDAIAGDPQARKERSLDDIYMLYTGGTTGMPKGVMYSLGDISESLTTSAFINMQVPAIDTAEGIAEFVVGLQAKGMLGTACPAPPLMHATGAWIGAFMGHVVGGCCVLLEARSLDPDEIIGVASRGLGMLVIVGDAFARPLLKRLNELRDAGTPADLSGLSVLLSSGAMLSAEVKDGIFEHHPGLVILDALGSSEGTMGTKVSVGKGSGTTAKFEMLAGTRVFNDKDQEVVAGSGEQGMVGTTGAFLPIGYYKDPEKSARTFRTVAGVRYSFPGDMATVAADGSIELLGRGSNCINTGGEKVFPEEVEEALKTHGSVDDCLVFGVDDDRFGQAVTAIVSVNEAVEEKDLIAFVKGKLAPYKAPKSVHVVAQVPRAPNGKADYKSARTLVSN